MMANVKATASTTVARPIDQVWATLTDHEGMATWAPGISVSIDQPGSPEANGVGAVRRIKAGPGATFVEEVVTFDAPNLFGYAARAGVPIPGYQGEVRLTPEGEGTRIDYTVSSTSSFPLLKPVLIGQGQLLMRLFARAAAK